MTHMLIFGQGYSASVLARHLRARGWTVAATGRAGTMRFDDTPAVTAALAAATHVLSSVPPDPASGTDPVLTGYGALLPTVPWLGYLSSTGVYGDTGGAWVDETAPIGTGRRSARAQADLAWQALGARVFRLPGIYGPGRSVFDRLRAGTAHRIDLPGQVFSRIHVEDIAGGVIAALSADPGVWNLSDDLPAPQNAVVEHAARLAGLPLPPLLGLDEARLSPAALAFYHENRRVAAGKARRELGWRARYATYREGLVAVLAGV